MKSWQNGELAKCQVDKMTWHQESTLGKNFGLCQWDPRDREKRSKNLSS
jgi:hypothetical protein